MDSHAKSTKLLQSDLIRCERPIDNTKYEEYRMNLEASLNRIQRHERLVYHICWVSLVIAAILMFVGGSGVLGSFDPYDDRANALSIALGVIFVTANITFAVSFASMYSRFQPGAKRIREDLRDANLADAKREIVELRKRVETMDRR